MNEVSQKAKKETEELKRVIDRYKFLCSKGPAVIYASKAYGDFGAFFISENIEDQMGYKAKDFIQNSRFWVNHIHPDDKDQTLKELDQLFKKGEHSHEYRFKHKDGSYKWMFDEMRLIRDKNGKPKEIIGYWMDITKRKEAEEELNMKIMELERTNKLMVGRELKMIELKKKLKNK